MKTKSQRILPICRNWMPLLSIAACAHQAQLNADQFGSGSNQGPDFRVASAADLNSAFRIERISGKSGNIGVEWRSLGEGWAYRLQARDLAAEDTDWTNLPTRYRWPTTATKWTDAGAATATGIGRLYRVAAVEVLPPERGKLLEAELMHSISTRNVQTRLGQASYPIADLDWGVEIYRVVYETVDPFGLSITASGALIVPVGTEQAIPMMSWQHGTEIYKGSPRSAFDSVPSERDSYYHNLGIFYASSGYLTAMPDYLGLGDSPGLHPYLHAESEASAVIDMLRAARIFCDENGVALNADLFLAGYSQGGHATIAAQREIESNHSEEFTVTASAPMAGPYDMSGSLDYLLSTPDYPYPLFFAYVLAAWMPIYDLADTLETFFSDPYDRRLVPHLDGRSTFDQVDAAMAPDVPTALDPGFLVSIQSDSSHAFWLAAEKNDLLNWMPRAPIRIFHCAGDKDVPYANAEAARSSYESKGACCVEIADPTPHGSVWGHQDCYRPSIVGAKQWFDSLKR